MSDETPVFLTEQRRAVMTGDYDGQDSTERAHKTNIRARSRTALSEMIDVANSPHIENREALPPEQVGELIESVVAPRTEPEGYDEYRRDLYFHVRRALDIIEELD